MWIGLHDHALPKNVSIDTWHDSLENNSGNFNWRTIAKKIGKMESHKSTIAWKIRKIYPSKFILQINYKVLWKTSTVNAADHLVITCHKKFFWVEMMVMLRHYICGNCDCTTIFNTFKAKIKCTFVTPTNGWNYRYAFWCQIGPIPAISEGVVHLQRRCHVGIQAKVWR